MTPEEMTYLVDHLRSQRGETELVEFKLNNADPKEIGENVSALSNSAALQGRSQAFILWGVEDQTHRLVGTGFRPRTCKRGNEELESWLHHQFLPPVGFRIHEGTVSGCQVVLLEVPPAAHRPIGFSGVEFIRVGSYTKKLKDHPEKERALWAVFSEKPFEKCIAAPAVTPDEVLSLIDHTACFRLLGIPLPDGREAIFSRLAAERIVVPCPGDRFDITNLGAILFAADLRRFGRLARKSPRVVIYRGENRTETIKEHDDVRGYALAFDQLVSYINDQLPHNEEIQQALRKQVRLYPEIAVRELVANALIHQDFHATGTSPMVEIFSGRMEITNPGKSLIDTLRFIDEPPQSRNEMLASTMRRLSICEERGSGIDKVVEQVEAFQLPAPDFRTTPSHTVAVLFGPRDFAKMSRQDRVRACYQHACLWYVSGKQMTNGSLRARLRIDQKNYPIVSRIIRDTIEAKLIRQAGGTRKDARYVPSWA